MSKALKVITWIFVGVLTTASVATSGYFIYEMIKKNNPISGQDDGGITYYKNHIEKISQEKDKDILDFYNSHTKSLQIQYGSYLTRGTTWVFPANKYFNNYDDTRVYFATNIHVISGVLTKDYSNNSYPTFGFSFIRYANFYLDIDNSNRFNPIELRNVKLERIALTNKYYNYLSTPNPNKLNYSDFAIFSFTKQPFYNYGGLNLSGDDVDFIDSNEEFNQIKNINEFYLAGFPTWRSANNNDFRNDFEMKTAKYIKTTNGNFDVFNSTTRLLFGKQQYLNQKSALPIPSKYEENPNYTVNELYWSYANQLIFPNLNMNSGSSGSMMLVKINNKIKILGIYWGVYKTQNDQAFGAIDFLWTQKYHLNDKTTIVNGYDNLNDQSKVN